MFCWEGIFVYWKDLKECNWVYKLQVENLNSQLRWLFAIGLLYSVWNCLCCDSWYVDLFRSRFVVWHLFDTRINRPVAKESKQTTTMSKETKTKVYYDTEGKELDARFHTTQEHLSDQDLRKLDITTLNPLSPEVSPLFFQF